MYCVLFFNLFSATFASSSELLFKNTLSKLSASSSDNNYLNLIERLSTLEFNKTCQLITRDGKCFTFTERTTPSPTTTMEPTTEPITEITTDLPFTTSAIISGTSAGIHRRSTETTLRPINVAKKFLVEILKAMAPKTKLAQTIFNKAQTNNQTATYQFLMGATISNSIMLNKIKNQINVNQNISKGSSLLTLLMFICSLLGSIIYIVKKYKTYKKDKSLRKNEALETYYVRRRDLENRLAAQRLAIEEA